MVRLGVRELLDGKFEVEEAATWRDALEALTDTGGFDVAVVEIDPRGQAEGEPVGARMIRTLRRAMPGTGIVAHARQAERQAASEVLKAGACGYVAKSSPPEALQQAIEAAAESIEFIDPAANGNRLPLTKRQREILQHVADGHSTSDVAHRLGLSAETVRTHMKAALARLDARDRTHAVAIGLRSGLIN